MSQYGGTPAQTSAKLVAGLAELPAGPELAAALAGVDRGELGGAEVYEVLAARARQLAHDQALLLADLLQAAQGGADPHSGGAGAELGEFCADESAFTLRWSGRYAFGQTLLARDLIHRLPVVYAALLAGRIDLCRAEIFSDALLDLDQARAQKVAATLIGPAGGLTPAELRRRLRYHVLRAEAT